MVRVTERATRGYREINPARSRVSSIWCTGGGLTRKKRWMSVSAGARPCRRREAWVKARYCPCRGVKPGRSSGEVVSISSPRCGGDAMNIRFRVELSEAERNELTAMLSGGRRAARKLKRAQILLAADAGSSDEAIIACVGVGASTVYRTKRRFVEGNLSAALEEAPRPGVARKLSGKEEALLVADRLRQPARGSGSLDP